MSKNQVVQEVSLMDQNQHDRLSGLLADFERDHGPIDPQMMEKVRREWYAPGKKTSTHRIT